MKMKTVNTIFVVLFMLMLLAPLVCIDVSGGGISEQENRVLASRPAMGALLTNPSDFVKRFDRWFSDNIGFRERLIRFYQLQNSMQNQVQYMEGEFVYLIGEQGHRYFAELNGMLIRRFQGKYPLSDERASALVDWLNQTKQSLDAKNIPFMMMLCTDKETIYPEYYPKAIHRGPGPTELERITAYLHEHTNVEVFNTRECLWSQKNNFLLYNKATGDLGHYNEIGAYFSYVELMKHIQPHYPAMRSFALEDIDISYDESGSPSVAVKAEAPFKKLGADFFDGVDVLRPFTWENEAYENADLSLPTILFLRDSYASHNEKRFLMNYIPHHFGRTILIYYRNIKYLDAYIAAYEPDIVVFEAGERMLYWFCDILLGTSS